MKPIVTNWQFYGDSPVPWWALATLALMILALAIRWARAEVKRASFASRLLPITLTLLFALAAWLVYRPVLVRVDTWEHVGPRLALLDTSASMNEPYAAAGDLTAALDLLTMEDPTLVTQRPLGAMRLRAELAVFASSAERHRRALQSIHEQVAQGVPLSGSTSTVLSEFGTWVRGAKSRLRGLITEAQLAASSRSAEQAPVAAGAVKDLALLGECVERLHAEVESPTPDAMQAALMPLETLIAQSRSIGGSMAAIQSLSDSAFVAKNQESLKARIESMRAKSRVQVAREAMKRIGLEPAAIVSSDVTATRPSVHGEQTNIYGDLASLLRQHEGETLTALYVFSDGGDNVGAAPDVLDEIRKSGLSCVSVGVGSRTSGGIDLAILDWECRRVSVAQRDFTLNVLVKCAAGVKTPLQLTLAADGAVIASSGFLSNGRATQVFTLRAKAPEAGAHTLRLTLAASEDLNPRNNAVTFAMDTVASAPQALVVAPFADWDTSYLTLAGQRNGMLMRQANAGDMPRRGESVDAIPNSLGGWSKYRTVVLKGAPFKSFSEADAADLHRYVTESGGSLLVFVDEKSYFAPLANGFGWKVAPRKLVDATTRISPEAMHDPLLRVDVDGPQSAQRFASLPPVGGACAVPAQDRVFLVNADGEPIFSVGAYGRGRVFLLGASGLFTQREFSRALCVDRFLRQLLSECAIPSAGARNGAVDVGLNNPGMEQLFSEYNESFMAHLADAADGRFVPVTQIAAEVAGDAGPKPVVWRDSTAQRFPLAEHWLIHAAIIVVATLHWVLRKLAGLAI